MTYEEREELILRLGLNEEEIYLHQEVDGKLHEYVYQYNNGKREKVFLEDLIPNRPTGERE